MYGLLSVSGWCGKNRLGINFEYVNIFRNFPQPHTGIPGSCELKPGNMTVLKTFNEYVDCFYWKPCCFF